LAHVVQFGRVLMFCLGDWWGRVGPLGLPLSTPLKLVVGDTTRALILQETPHDCIHHLKASPFLL